LADFSGHSEIYIPKKENFGANTMITNFYEPKEIKKKYQIQVKRLDNYIIKNINFENIGLIKIDVEGFEFFVLKGMENFFKLKCRNLPPLLVEITPSFYRSSEIGLKDLKDYMESYSYSAFTIDEKYKIDLMSLENTQNPIDILFKLKSN